jgi:hypothetical protein
MVSADGSSLAVQGEGLLMPADAAQSIPSYRNQAALVGGRGGEGRPTRAWAPRRISTYRNPDDLVDCGADNGEIEQIR